MGSQKNLALTLHSQYVVISTFHAEQNLPNATLNGHQLRKQFFNKCPHSEHTTSVKVWHMYVDVKNREHDQKDSQVFP